MTVSVPESLNFFLHQIWFFICNNVYLLDGCGNRIFLSSAKGRLSTLFQVLGACSYSWSFHIWKSRWSGVAWSHGSSAIKENIVENLFSLIIAEILGFAYILFSNNLVFHLERTLKADIKIILINRRYLTFAWKDFLL